MNNHNFLFGYYLTLSYRYFTQLLQTVYISIGSYISCVELVNVKLVLRTRSESGIIDLIYCVPKIFVKKEFSKTIKFVNPVLCPLNSFPPSNAKVVSNPLNDTTSLVPFSQTNS